MSFKTTDEDLKRGDLVRAWSNQEGFVFTNEEYKPHPFEDLVVITY